MQQLPHDLSIIPSHEPASPEWATLIDFGDDRPSDEVYYTGNANQSATTVASRALEEAKRSTLHLRATSTNDTEDNLYCGLSDDGLGEPPHAPYRKPRCDEDDLQNFVTAHSCHLAAEMELLEVGSIETFLEAAEQLWKFDAFEINRTFSTTLGLNQLVPRQVMGHFEENTLGWLVRHRGASQVLQIQARTVMRQACLMAERSAAGACRHLKREQSNKWAGIHVPMEGQEYDPSIVGPVAEEVCKRPSQGFGALERLHWLTGSKSRRRRSVGQESCQSTCCTACTRISSKSWD